ncbi:MAG: amidohydrolase [Renibacterium salmoninarum]|nr:amidohydrolase [Renibacterium salmoninarum]
MEEHQTSRKKVLTSRRVVLGAGLGIAIGGAAGFFVNAQMQASQSGSSEPADLVIQNANITTLNPANPQASTVAIRGGRIVAVGESADTRAYLGPATKVIDARGRRLIPGLNDSHMHLVSYGATFNRETRWEGITSLKEALQAVSTQAQRTPAGEWVRVLGGWSPYQFTERRLPTVEELTQAAPEVPVMVTHLWDRVILNRRGIEALGLTSDTPDPEGGYYERDGGGNPTGVLIAVSDWAVILDAMGRLPGPVSLDERVSSTRQYAKVLNSFGVTSVLDGGAGAYPNNYAALQRLADDGNLTVRVSGTLFPAPGTEETTQFTEWLENVDVSQRDPFFQIIGAGEIISYEGFDMTNFQVERPAIENLEAAMRPLLESVIAAGWTFRLHAAYEQTISRTLDVLESIAGGQALKQRWSIEHAETITRESARRIRALGGGVGVQSRLMFQSEEFSQQYQGTAEMANLISTRMLLDEGLPVGFGTDSMRISSYNPWWTSQFFVDGRGLSGQQVLDSSRTINREEALRLSTVGGAWFSGEETIKGIIAPGQFADLCLLEEDYFSVPADQINQLRASLTIVDGKVVYGTGEYETLVAPVPEILPTWSPYNS